MSTDWTVVTDKNLSFSNLFLFNLFYDGETSPVAVSETFNITDDSSSSTTTSSATSSSTTSSSTASSLTTSSPATFVTAINPTSSATAATTATTTSVASDQSGGLSTGTKAGIGIAVSAAALGGIAVGYYLFQHKAKKQQYVAPPHAAEQSPVPIEQKSADITAELTSERPTYELHGLSGPTMMYELSGDASRH